MPQQLSGPVKCFLRQMIDLLCCFWKKDHPIRLNKELHHDLQWWHQFLIEWHGVSFWLFPGIHLQQTLKFPPTRLVPWALAFWGPQWCRQHVLFCSDNNSVIHILNVRTSKVPCLLLLLRALLLTATCDCFPGVTNSIADALSRFDWQDFHCLAPEAHPHPTPIPPQLLQDLISPL